MGRPRALAHVAATAALALALPGAFQAATASAAPAPAVPPALARALEGQRAAAQERLERARATLATAAAAQRSAAATAERTSDRTEALGAVLELVGSELPEALAEDLARSTDRAARDRDEAQSRLDRATATAAAAQAAALDADRRIRAIRRASTTEADRDTTLGSWRFGSGGPGVSAESLDRYLASKGSPLAGEGAAFLAAGVEHEVDPRLVVAIAGAESYFGVITCAPHNAWGWGCPTSPFRFRSWAEAIDTVTLGIREGYVDDGLTSVGSIHLRYAPPNASNDPDGLNYAWPDNVARFLVEQGGDPQDIAGVLGPSR